METFFFAETLKYLYLLFGGHTAAALPPLSDLVFNTEAHAFPVAGSAFEDELLHILTSSPEGRRVRARWGSAQWWDGTCDLTTDCGRKLLASTAAQPDPKGSKRLALSPDAGFSVRGRALGAVTGAPVNLPETPETAAAESESDIDPRPDYPHAALVHYLRSKWEPLLVRVAMRTFRDVDPQRGGLEDPRLRHLITALRMEPPARWHRVLRVQRRAEEMGWVPAEAADPEAHVLQGGGRGPGVTATLKLAESPAAAVGMGSTVAARIFESEFEQA